MSNQIEITRKYVQDLTPSALIADKAIQEHIENKLCAIHRISHNEANAFYEREKDNLSKRISESAELRACTTMSIFMAMAQVCGWKLSFEAGGQSDVYLIPGNVNVGTKETPKWEKQVVAQPSPYGEKKIRIETGRIKHVDSPKVVFDVDDYSEETDANGGIMVSWKKGKRTDKSKIVGSFIRIQKADGTFEFKTFDSNDIARWGAASAKKNRGVANQLYTSNGGQIDIGFLEGKTLKHAFKLYPRVVADITLPSTFVPTQEETVRQGLDVSEFTEDVPHVEVVEETEFSKALEEQSQEEPEKILVIAGDDDDDEPAF